MDEESRSFVVVIKVAVFSIMVTLVASQNRQSEVGMRFFPGSYPGVYVGPYPGPYPGGYVGGIPAASYPRIISPPVGYPVPGYPISGGYPINGGYPISGGYPIGAGYPIGGSYPGLPVFYNNKNSGGKT